MSSRHKENRQRQVERRNRRGGYLIAGLMFVVFIRMVTSIVEASTTPETISLNGNTSAISAPIIEVDPAIQPSTLGEYFVGPCEDGLEIASLYPTPSPAPINSPEPTNIPPIATSTPNKLPTITPAPTVTPIIEGVRDLAATQTAPLSNDQVESLSEIYPYSNLSEPLLRSLYHLAIYIEGSNYGTSQNSTMIYSAAAEGKTANILLTSDHTMIGPDYQQAIDSGVPIYAYLNGIDPENGGFSANVIQGEVKECQAIFRQDKKSDIVYPVAELLLLETEGEHSYPYYNEYGGPCLSDQPVTSVNIYNHNGPIIYGYSAPTHASGNIGIDDLNRHINYSSLQAVSTGGASGSMMFGSVFNPITGEVSEQQCGTLNYGSSDSTYIEGERRYFTQFTNLPPRSFIDETISDMYEDWINAE